MNPEYKQAVIETAIHAFKLVRTFEEQRSGKPVCIDGPLIAAIRGNPDLDETTLRACLNEFGRKAYETRLAPEYFLDLTSQVQKLRQRKTGHL